MYSLPLLLPAKSLFVSGEKTTSRGFGIPVMVWTTVLALISMTSTVLFPSAETNSRFAAEDRKSTRLNSSHGYISYAVFCLKKKKKKENTMQSESNTEVMKNLVVERTIQVALCR